MVKKFLLFSICFMFVSIVIYSQCAEFPDDYYDTIMLFDEVKGEDTVFDWRTFGVVPSAGSQGLCGSCWAFATAGSFTAKVRMLGFNYEWFSVLQQVLCNTSQNGCQSGNPKSINYYNPRYSPSGNSNHGPMLWSCTGYDWANDTCEDIQHCQELPFRTVEYHTILQEQEPSGNTVLSVNDVKASLLTYGPGWFGFLVHDDFEEVYWQQTEPQDWDPGNPAYRNREFGPESLHAVMIIGWNNEYGAWICLNSWGSNAGPYGDGSFLIRWHDHVYDVELFMANFGAISKMVPE